MVCSSRFHAVPLSCSRLLLLLSLATALHAVACCCCCGTPASPAAARDSRRATGKRRARGAGIDPRRLLSRLRRQLVTSTRAPAAPRHPRSPRRPSAGRIGGPSERRTRWAKVRRCDESGALRNPPSHLKGRVPKSALSVYSEPSFPLRTIPVCLFGTRLTSLAAEPGGPALRASGLLGIYTVLPQPRPAPHEVSGAAAAAA
jgi:hypothetical protein